ncbi:MAG: VanZ family protein [Desulfuromonadales bacterium]
MTSDTGKTIGSLTTPKALLRFCLPTVWAGVILWLSLTSSPPEIKGFLGWDKLLHAGAYGLLALLSTEFFYFMQRSLPRAVVFGILVTLAFGALMEILQAISGTGRTAEWLDLVADAVGAIAGCVVFCLAVVVSSRKSPTGRKPHAE